MDEESKIISIKRIYPYKTYASKSIKVYFIVSYNIKKGNDYATIEVDGNDVFYCEHGKTPVRERIGSELEWDEYNTFEVV